MASAHTISTAIIGVTGYEGANIARLIAHHPQFRLVAATARASAGQRLDQALPALSGTSVAALTITEGIDDAELVFVAVPHGVAATLVAAQRGAGRRVVDLSADFRFTSAAEYAAIYGHAHPAPEWLGEAVYGLPELRRADIRGASIVANPGCFPTAAILALAPALGADLITPEAIVDAKTAITGAGRSPSRRVHFSEIHDSVAAYSLAGHRHMPEMAQALAKGDARPAITFVPHLVPMNRGLLATCYATLHAGVTEALVRASYQEWYAHEPFITLSAEPPETNWVRGSNRCAISLHVQGQRLIVVSAIDNLMKGGAGQAIQNANLLFDLPETTGLAMEGLWP